MPAFEGLPLSQLASQRGAFLDRVRHLGADRAVSESAAARLEYRLREWTGNGIASPQSRFKNKIARGEDATCIIGSDQEEILIVRALAVTRGECQYTVSTNGAVFASEASGWTIDRTRVYVSGLSPLIDDAADILRQMRGSSGGRMFFDRQNSFLNARDRRRFLTVIEGSTPPTVRTGGSRSTQTLDSPATCPTCYQELPLTGLCNFC